MRVLIVDDEPFIVAFVTKHLLQSGFDVDSTGDGAEALIKIQAQIPDVLICDNLMPVMDGYELIMALRDDVRYQEIKIILIAVLPQRFDNYRPYDIKMLSELTNIRYRIFKPFNPAETIQAISRVTQQQK